MAAPATTGGMGYLLCTVELTEPLPTVRLAPDQNGVGLVLRRHDTPVGFVLHALAPGAVLCPAAFAALLDGHLGAAATARPPLDPDAAARVPSVAVAVCTRNRPVRLARCLKSIEALAASAWGRRVGLDILVVDNAPSDDRARQVVCDVPGARYVHEPKRGLNFARNLALAEAGSEILAYFDDDVVVDHGWLRGLVAAWREHPDAAAFTGPVLPYELVTRAQIIFEQWGGFGHRFKRVRWEPAMPGIRYYPCSPGMIGTGCNMAFRRDELVALGGFDEALDTGAPLPGGGDLDMLYRVLRGEYPIITEPECLVFHQHRRQHRALRFQMWTWGLGFMAFVTKSYRSDPAQRPLLRRVVVAHFRRAAKNVLTCAIGRGGRPTDQPMSADYSRENVAPYAMLLCCRP